MNNLYETLEICLREIEQGADIDTVLFRYPELADELAQIGHRDAGRSGERLERGVEDRQRMLVRANQLQYFAAQILIRL